MLPQHNPRTPEAKGAIGPGVKLNDKVTLVIGRIANVEGGVRREGLKRVQICMDVSAGTEPERKSAIRAPREAFLEGK